MEVRLKMSMGPYDCMIEDRCDGKGGSIYSFVVRDRSSGKRIVSALLRRKVDHVELSNLMNRIQGLGRDEVSRAVLEWNHSVG